MSDDEIKETARNSASFYWMISMIVVVVAMCIINHRIEQIEARLTTFESAQPKP